MSSLVELADCCDLEFRKLLQSILKKEPVSSEAFLEAIHNLEQEIKRRNDADPSEEELRADIKRKQDLLKKYTESYETWKKDLANEKSIAESALYN